MSDKADDLRKAGLIDARHHGDERANGMFELLIIACLAGQPSLCEEFHVPFERPTGMRNCMHHAQFRLMEWMEAMPGWNVKKWTCGLPKA